MAVRRRWNCLFLWSLCSGPVIASWCGLPSHLHILENSQKCIVIQQGRDGHHTNGVKKGGAFTIHGIIAVLPLDTPKGFQSPAVGLTYS
jgi:hypothetical protein